MSGLSIGILVDSPLKQQYLGNMVVQAGHKIGFAWSLSASSVLPGIQQNVDAWVVDVNEPDDGDETNSQKMALSAFIDNLLEQTSVPVIVNDAAELTQSSADYNNWVRRMLQRLERLSGDINLQASGGASEVWVLGASTGGPAAVKDFLKQLPPELNVAFVYVQHIDSGQAETLVKMMSSAGRYSVSIARQGSVLSDNTITLVTADRSVSIHDNGTLVVGKNPWGGCYSPSIDQVTANVARVYRQRSGIIIFSGMGDDGAASCRLIKQQGGKVWVQSPEQSTISSMPEAAIATGTVSFTGTPPELADALARLKSPRSIKQYS
ncbi:protein-glutamate methylesterase [Cellvibrio zantedeschiae]|uniref:protein-glutamate methylesterase n=1 Tax=Cellvibrio zantedeschiae TaxID=1237077 RepID=A0ABQ3BA27_9GAMM|nr:chemotaxis protein CheB [Cellvibrio zantedeschiae]GGY82595.1 protein-glutamate methylesterase [Cellvibrio zantedeschiae]